MSNQAAVVKADPVPTSEELKKRFGRDIFRDFDYEDPKFNDTFFDVLDEQLAHCPVARSNVGTGFWWVTRNEDVRRIGQDWKSFSNAKGYQPNRPADLPYLFPEESDPPIHTTWRNVLNPFLSPKACASYEARVRSDVNALIDRFIGTGECEFITEFGALLPGWAFFKNVMGVPLEDLQMLVDSVEWGTFAPTAEEKGKHFEVIFGYLSDLMKRRAKETPRGDMVDAIVKGVTYPDGTHSTFEENLSVMVDLTFGGIATTTYVMGSAIHYLATHPADREMLLQNPEMIPMAVEEFIRVFPPIVALGRTAMKDVEVAGTQIKEGDYVMMAYSAASRDPRVIDNAGTVDITRKNVVHSTFGVGPHRCIGSNLARVELVATLDEWLKRIPKFSQKEGTEPVYLTAFLRSMRKLQLVF